MKEQYYVTVSISGSRNLAVGAFLLGTIVGCTFTWIAMQ